jgi:nucleoside-diphosphate-sugar epimerase
MRVFVVIGTYRSAGNAERLRALAAEPVLLDLLDPAAVRRAVLEAQPDAIVHQATALADARFSKHLDRSFVETNRLRTEGTDSLLAAARETGASRFVGDGGGMSSFIHLDDAAAATVLALEYDGPAIYNVVDDEPAAVRDWLPVLAETVGAKPPRHFPVWLARLFGGDAAVMLGTEAHGASNAKATRELGWTLRYPTWRRGFAAVYARMTSPAARHTMAAVTT